MSLFPEPEFKEPEVVTYRDLLRSEVESHEDDFITDGGDYGYEGWVSWKVADTEAITDYVLEKLQEFAKSKGVPFP